MNQPGKRPESRRSIFSKDAQDRLWVDLDTGKLYWDDKEIVARKTVDFTGINRVWAWIVAFVALCAGVGSALDGLVNLNKETCWIKIGACKVAPTPPPPKAQESIVLPGVYFDTNSPILKLESGPALEKLVQSLKADPSLHIEIQGYTDNTGAADRNLKLSADRAASVKQWLIDNGIAGERLTSEGYGALSPIADNGTIEGRAKNRRVEFRKM
jgi:outer membrane protein OmpA-like peptidoglycan-associated protein